ncbi:thioesterase family protein [Mycobacterium sp. MYCO198283]|uniref:thioesterase family protein n=1 Tax=Mycobacterium sp. MYCO198283 TaxID=2883505 RepID=UPI001E419AD4|nr:thioesterase family protein [Mycobacterium sp. MYCO198283]MCG5432314.1 thioesterase family protein [Mycobacterium sp. MYCO198283]
MSDDAVFADAMALREIEASEGGPVYEAQLSAHWTIGPKVHGGMMLALCAAAARAALGGEAQPVAVSANFLWAPSPGPMRLETLVRKRGRRINLVDVELRQGDRVADERSREEYRASDERSREEYRASDERSREEYRTAVRAEVTLGPPEHGEPPLLSANPVPTLMPPEPPAELAPIGPGHPSADVMNLWAGCDIRPDLSTYTRPADGSAPRFQLWIRPRDAAPDVLFALMAGDISAPVTFAVDRFGWAPTVQMTAYLRGMPSDGWLRVLCTTTEIGRDWFDADHVVVDSTGRLVVQTRQLALVPD